MRLHHTVFGTVCFLLAGLGCPVGAAPLHPRFLGDPSVRVPPEPHLDPGVQGVAAARFGRHWTGHPRLLVLLVDFSDRPADALAHPAAYFEELLFSQDRIATGSLRDWYDDATLGKIVWEGRAFGWFRMPLTYAAYASDQSGFCTCYPNNALGLVDHAFQAAVAAGINLRDFDNDGPDGIPGSGDDDGVVDGMAVVFAGLGAERTGLVTDLRSHYSSTINELQAAGIRVPDYVLFPEGENIGVVVHEIGHLLGAIDLYDLTGRAAGLGYYSIMSYGIWFNNARQPGGPDPYTRMLWGVVEPEVLQADENGLELLPVLESGHVLKLWTRGEQGPEYFLLEHRTTHGIDGFLFGDGLLLYHVDENVGAQTNASQYRVDLVQADGLRTLNGAGTVRNLGEFGDYFPGSTGAHVIDSQTVPSTLSYTGENTGVALRNIGNPAHIVFDAEVGRFLGTAPDPRLYVLPDEDPFASAVRPEEAHTVRLRIENQGTRLGAGSVRVFSRDARVVLPQAVEFQAASLGALQTVPLAEVTVVVKNVGPEEPASLPLEISWTVPERTWTVAAALPLLGNVRLREGFEVQVPHVTTRPVSGGVSPWSRVSGGFEGAFSWQTVNYQGYQEAVLEIGPVAVPGHASELRFQQKLSFPVSGTYGYDGGFLEASVDGGPWMLLEPEGGYPLVFGYAEGNDYPNHPCWGGRSDWHEVVVPFSLRGNVTFRFHFVSDFTGSEGGLYQGWYVDAVLVRSWEHAHAIVFDPPQFEGETATVDFEVMPLFHPPAAEAMRMVRDGGDGESELGRWTATDRRRESVRVSGLKPDRVERLWIEWQDGDRERPYLIVPPGAERTRLLDPTPALLRRGESGRITYRVPGNEALPVELDVFDIRGARVARLEEGVREPGSHVHVGFPDADVRAPLGAGVYVLRFSGPGFSDTRRVVVLMP